MIVYRTKADLRTHLDRDRQAEKSIGLVPTMGALHAGHASLVSRAVEENDVSVVSIFVNPTQFNDPGDLKKYPRTLDADLQLLQKLNTSVVFAPQVAEMYPRPDNRLFDLGGLDQVMEGRQRPGHFNGVAQIVSKLFEAVNPAKAYFGQKDFQQLVVIRELTRLLEMDIDIVSCPIVRENDGLAMSSRNVHLDKKSRAAAPFIYATLQKAREKKKELDPANLKIWVKEAFEKQAMMQLEYFEIVDDKRLQPVKAWKDKVNKVACIAVQINGIRLIDNLHFD